DYAMRGESENRNKEFKCDLAMDRTSDHRFLANYFRLYLHGAAMNLLIRLRRHVAEPPAASSTPTPVLEPLPEVPVEAWTGAHRRRYFRWRRHCDPLGEGHPCTWRTLLIKVAAEIVVSSRRILVRLSASWPHLDFFRQLSEHLTSATPRLANPSG